MGSLEMRKGAIERKLEAIGHSGRIPGAALENGMHEHEY